MGGLLVSKICVGILIAKEGENSQNKEISSQNTPLTSG